MPTSDARSQRCRDTGPIVSLTVTKGLLKAHWGLWLAAALGGIGIGGLALLDLRTGTLRAEYVPETIAWYLIAFAGFVVAVVWNEVATISWRWLWLIPIAFRLILLTTDPTLSDDVYRYLWEGHLVTQGVSPYAYSIVDPALDPYAIPAQAMVNNPTLASPYLPAAHGLFALVALALPSQPLTMQVVMVVFDLVAAVLITRLLGLADLPPKRVLLYLWNPLVIVETAHGAHLDAFILALVTGALVLTFAPASPTGRFSRLGRFGAPLLLALAALTRPVPLLLAPVLLWRWSWAQRAAFFLTLAVALVPFGLFGDLGLSGEAGTGLFGSARAYSESFRFNSGIYHWLERWIGGQGLDDRGWNAPMELTKLIIAALAGFALVPLWWRARRITTEASTSGDSTSGDSTSGESTANPGAAETRRLLRLMAKVIAVYVLLTPVLHPWYAALLLALLVFVAPGADEDPAAWVLLVGWGYLSATVMFSYLTYVDPTRFAELEWVRQLQWLPTLSLLVLTIGWFSRHTNRRHMNKQRTLKTGVFTRSWSSLSW